MANGSTHIPKSKPSTANSAVELAGLSDEGIGYIEAIFSAITELADAPHMQDVVAELAKCGSWVAENLKGNVQHLCRDIALQSREVH